MLEVNWSDGRGVLFTDEVSRDNQFRSLRRAGLGVSWGHGHPCNVAEPLRGLIQINNRAELAAVI